MRGGETRSVSNFISLERRSIPHVNTRPRVSRPRPHSMPRANRNRTQWAPIPSPPKDAASSRVRRERAEPLRQLAVLEAAHLELGAERRPPAHLGPIPGRECGHPLLHRGQFLAHGGGRARRLGAACVRRLEGVVEEGDLQAERRAGRGERKRAGLKRREVEAQKRLRLRQ